MSYNNQMNQPLMDPNMQLNMALNPNMGGHSPVMGMQQGPPLLWPNGVGITDRDKNPEECSCPPCFCWTRPVWFMDQQFASKGQESGWDPKCSGCGWDIREGDVMGTKLTFEGKECCGVETCYEPEIHITESGKEVGKAIMKMPCFACGDTAMCEGRTAQNVPRFQRIENPWCPQFYYWSGEMCGWQEFNWPVFNPQQGRAGGPLTHITFKYHCCFVCRPVWVGVRRWPVGCTQDDQKILLGMAISRWWRSERQQQQQNNANQSGGMNL